jgi:hypothetical protein
VVDAARLARVLARVRQDLAVLRGYASVSRHDLAADDVRMGHVKYLRFCDRVDPPWGQAGPSPRRSRSVRRTPQASSGSSAPCSVTVA